MAQITEDSLKESVDFREHICYTFRSYPSPMVIAIAVLAAFYFTGVYLLVSSLSQEPEWFEDENGELHHLPRMR